MNFMLRLPTIFFVLLFSLALGCSIQLNGRPLSSAKLDPPPLLKVAATTEPIAPLPQQIEDLSPEKIALGEQLFSEPRLSGNNSISCASCHNLHLGGTDRQRISPGLDGAVSPFNTPTVFNSAYNFLQFWDGRAESLEEQIDEPIHNEMGSDWEKIIVKLQQDAGYRQQFREIYGSNRSTFPVTSATVPEINPDTIRDAIATYQRALITPNSPFDRYLRGDLSALTSQQTDGYEKFKAYGCISCHQGINIGGNMLQRFGIFGNYYEDRRNVRPESLGRYNITGESADRYVFKVPGLRNVELTPPYFHDGSVETLAGSVRIMGRYQLGRNLDASEVDAIVAFLKSLTGEPPATIGREERA